MAAALFASNRGHGAVLHAGRLSGTIVVDRLGPLSLISDGGSGCYLPRLTGIWSDPLHHSRDRDMSSIPIVVSPSVRLPERSALPRNGSMAAVGRAPGLRGEHLSRPGGTYPPRQLPCSYEQQGSGFRYLNGTFCGGCGVDILPAAARGARAAAPSAGGHTACLKRYRPAAARRGAPVPGFGHRTLTQCGSPRTSRRSVGRSNRWTI